MNVIGSKCPTCGRPVDPTTNPPPDFNAIGENKTNVFRIRAGWFGFPILEELVENMDGSKKWMKSSRGDFPIPLTEEFHRAATGGEGG